MTINLKIANILPLTENFSVINSGAASLLVRDNIKFSSFKHFVYGATKFKDFPSKKYFNIKLKRNFFRSANMSYIKKLTKNIQNKNYDIIEIHNRPEIALHLKKNTKIKTFLYFHNDPLTLRQSKTLKQREKILNDIDHIFFVSEWVRSRFFENLDFKNSHKISVVYPTIKKQKIDFNKKKKKDNSVYW